MKDHHGCPVQASINVMSGNEGPFIFPLARTALGTPEKVAEDFREGPSASTGQLEGDGVLTRKVTTTNPPQVTYALNAEGKKLVPFMEALCDWGSAHFGIKPNLPRHATRP
jgi:hypothetical protein